LIKKSTVLSKNSTLSQKSQFRIIDRIKKKCVFKLFGKNGQKKAGFQISFEHGFEAKGTFRSHCFRAFMHVSEFY